jgi:pimeloyl-ACP methyl ester carboxylesterase
MFATPPRHKNSRHSISIADPLEPNSRRVDLELRDGRVNLSATSIGDGPTVMLVHGWGGSSVDMSPAADAFARAGWRAVSFDMPGHGRSSGKESSLVEFLHAMQAVSTALGRPDLIVGHSFGATAAALGINELGLAVRGAVLFAPAPGPGYYVDRFARAVGLPPERTDGMVRHLVERVGRPFESLDALTAARAATVPALIVHDRADREVPFTYAERMADAWRGSRLMPVRSLGHKRLLRDPETIAAAVDFARALPNEPLTGGGVRSLQSAGR